MPEFVRPESLSFPQIYHTFKAKSKAGDEIAEYRVQDLPEEHYEQVVKLMVKHFIPDEALCVCKKIAENEMCVRAMSDSWREILKHRLSIGCFVNDCSNELVGVNVLAVNSIKDPKDESEVMAAH